MKVAALVSGGKDSILSLLLARRYGHTPVVLVNMCPAVTTHNNSSNSNNNNDDDDVDAHDIDSYMYQTVGHEAIEHVAACMQLPLRRGYVRRGQAKDVSMHYDEHVTRTTAAAATTTTTSASRDGCVHDTASSSTHCDNNNNTNDNNNDDDDEVEALYALLRDVTTEFTDVQAVTSGAILSSYQRHRVEHVCARLGLVSLAYLWQRSGAEVLDMAASLRVTAMLVKTASIGLQPRQLLGTTLDTAAPTLRAMARTYGVHMAGEGGEYETLVLDCPLFAHTRLHVRALRRVIVDDNAYAPCGYAVLSDVTRQDKSADARAADARVLARLTATCGRYGNDDDDDDEAFIFASDRMAALPSAARVRAARHDASRCHSPARQGIDDDDDDDATTTTTTTVLDWRQLQQLAAASSSTTTATTEQPRQLADAADTRRGRCVVERVVYCDAASYAARADNNNNNNNNNGGVDDEATASVAVAAATRDLLRRIDDDVRVHDASRVCAYTVYLSSAHVVRAFRDAYAQHTRWVRPPCCSIILVAAPTTTTPQDSCACSNNNNNTNTSSNSSKTMLPPRLPMCIRVCCVVASPVRCDVLHAQSRSCWAAAASPAGPYAQAWHVHASSSNDNNNNDDDDDTRASASYLVTAIVLGREPVHGAMATADDLCRYENNNNICSCHNADGAVTAHTAHATTTTMRSDHESGGDDVLTPFAVQFAYSYANCAAYVSYFGKTMADVTHVTVYVTPRAHAGVADVLAMWRCCYGGCCTDNNNNSAGDDTAAAVVVEVVHVDALHESDDAVVGLCVRQVVQRSGGGDDDV